MWVSLYIVYLAASAVWMSISYRRDWHEAWLRFILVAVLPVIGWLLPPFTASRRNDLNGNIDWNEISHGIEYLPDDGSSSYRMYTKETADKERNLVPLEEALLISDTVTRRRVMIDLLKLDTMKYLDVLQLAVSNEDTETSHYAVSAIMELKRKLTLTMQELSVRYEADKDDPHLLQSYADVLQSYLNSGFLDERTMMKHRYTYIAVLGRLIELDPGQIGTYTDKIEAEFAAGLYVDAEQTAKQFAERHPREEDAYLLLLKVYYNRRSFVQIRSTLNRMKASPIRFSNRALALVRYWSEGEEHEEKVKGPAQT